LLGGHFEFFEDVHVGNSPEFFCGGVVDVIGNGRRVGVEERCGLIGGCGDFQRCRGCSRGRSLGLFFVECAGESDGGAAFLGEEERGLLA